MTVLRSLDEQLAPAHTALLVIDVQNDFCHADGVLAARGADVARTNAVVIPRLSALVRDAAAAGVFVVFARIVQSPRTNSEAWEALEPVTGDRLVVEGSWGADYVDGLPLDRADVELVKHRHSAFAGTSLDATLLARGIRTVVLGGVATNVCVEGTAREAADRDYYVVVLEDGSGAAATDLHEQSLATVRRYLGRVATCDEVAAAWSAAAALAPDPNEPQEIRS